MKLKNIASGDFVQIKNSLCHSEFKAKQVCEVIDIDHTDKHGFDVLIQGKNCLDWVSHKHLKKPEPQLKQLDQSIFDGLDEKWRWFGVNSDGSTIRATNKPKINVSNNGFILLIGDSEFSDYNYDASNWQNSLIERDVAKELTGSDLARAMLARGDKYILCHLSQTSEKSAKDVLGIAIGHDHSGFRVQRHNSWKYAIPINNQGEPLTASEVGL